MKKMRSILSIVLALVIAISTTSVASNAMSPTILSAGVRDEDGVIHLAEEDTRLLISLLEEQGIDLNEMQNSVKEETIDGGQTKSATLAVTSTVAVAGIGTVGLCVVGGVLGAIVIFGIYYYAGDSIFETVYPYFIALSIPSRLKKDGKTVDLGEFDIPVPGKTAWKNKKTGWVIEKDTTGHGGRKWKLKNKKGDRKASLDGDGKILSK